MNDSSDKKISNFDLEVERLQIEKSRQRTELLKWIIISIGAIVSFIIIDYGKLKIEEFRETTHNQRELLNAYLRATDSPEPDIWQRKLSLIINSTDNKETINWAKKELNFIKDFAALSTLYKETLKVASQLIDPSSFESPERRKARVRYEQLYWVDLPFAKESDEVARAMVEFRNQLIEAEREGPNATNQWEILNKKLLQLADTINRSMPKRP